MLRHIPLDTDELDLRAKAPAQRPQRLPPATAQIDDRNRPSGGKGRASQRCGSEIASKRSSLGAPAFGPVVEQQRRKGGSPHGPRRNKRTSRSRHGVEGSAVASVASDLRRCTPVGTTTLETPAWLMRGVIIYNARPGKLTLERDRLSFRERGAEAALFDIALGDIGTVKFPFYNFGSVVRFDAGGRRYRLAFLASEPRSKWSGAQISDVRPARCWGKQWKAALTKGG